MRTELEIAQWWCDAWFRAWCEVPGKSVMLMKRHAWAIHRVERAERAVLPMGLRCWFCERPGHDETEKSCPERRVQAWCWAWDGMKWRGKEAA